MQLDDEIAGTVVPLLSRLPGYSQLTPTERDEVVRMANGLDCTESAAAANVPSATVRGHRRHIYVKLRISGMTELLLTLLDKALRMQDRLGRTEGSQCVRAVATAIDRYSGNRVEDLRASTAVGS